MQYVRINVEFADGRKRCPYSCLTHEQSKAPTAAHTKTEVTEMLAVTGVKTIEK